MSILEDIIKTKPIKDPYSRAFLNIMYTGTWLLSRINQVLKPFDLTEPQYNVLRILRGQQGEAMPLFEIQERMIQKMSNVSRLIDKLLEKGLVVRKECRDNRRKVDIMITKKGLDMLDAVEPNLNSLFDGVAKNLKKDDARLLGEMLDTLRKDL
ncbi:MarR family winged helix-turn-helix transcriptional regulator [Polluticoccus soli]|uniref:MarR family winged helix-turn-helix transcriptional regulator n=1 Tax=Polluticoccus soli TaxID=3034150 RepID=UPI0023E1A4D2|nr:MarR family transcriptional regulator [Flavipsychrobacter sp. JY13-12]